MTDSRQAYGELLALLHEVGERFAGPEWGITDPDDQADALRLVSHVLQSGLYAHQEADPDRPRFFRIVSPTRSFLGDNADALYFEAEVRGDREYTVTGNTAGAIYTSVTLEAEAVGGRYSAGLAGVLRDVDLDIDAYGSYQIHLGGPACDRNWLALPPGGGRITTRHYFEWPLPAAASQTLHVPLSIEPVTPLRARPRWDDASVAASLRRVANLVRSKTIDQPPRGTASPAFVSPTPNVFPDPVPPGTLAYSAFDAAYSMAPYSLGPDEALVIRGRWPECRFANVCLWTRFLQMYDYTTRSASRNRATTELEPDGTFRMIVAHRDPGLPNWLDTEGRSEGLIFWRFFLPVGDVMTPQATVCKLSDLEALT